MPKPISRNAEKLGIAFFKKWVGRRGELRETSRDGVGYDFTVKWKGSQKSESYEVKGTAGILKIPDMSVREFDRKRLRADFLFVVGNVFKSGKEVWYKIPRPAIRSENLRLKQTYHLRLFQNRKKMGQYAFAE